MAKLIIMPNPKSFTSSIHDYLINKYFIEDIVPGIKEPSFLTNNTIQMKLNLLLRGMYNQFNSKFFIDATQNYQKFNSVFFRSIKKHDYIVLFPIRSAVNRYESMFNMLYEMGNIETEKMMGLIKNHDMITNGQINQLLKTEIDINGGFKKTTVTKAVLNAPTLNILIKNLSPNKIFILKIDEENQTPDSINQEIKNKLDKFARILRVSIKNNDCKFRYISPALEIRRKKPSYEKLSNDNKKDLKRLSDIDKNYCNFLIKNSSVTVL